MKKKTLAILLTAILAIGIVGCTQAERVSHNVSKKADNFNVTRRLSVMSAITNKPVFELIGAFSFHVTDNRITATVETGPGQYKKHSAGFGENVVWVVEDLEGSNVNKYKYEVNFLPEMIQPIAFTTND